MSQHFSKLTDPELSKALSEGAVGVLPTDTLYGVACQASNESSVQRLYAIKKRDHKPGTIIAAQLDQLVELGLKRRYLTAVDQYWPGRVSIVIPCSDPALAYLHHNVGGLAVRIVDDKPLAKLLMQTGPLLTSSANNPGETPAGTIKAAVMVFGSDVDFYVDGGDLSKRGPSTLIRVVDDAVEVLRQGEVVIKNEGA